jgi:cation transport regulator
MRINAVPHKPGHFFGEMQSRCETGSEDDMPYATNDDLPVPVRRHLPQYAQRIYRTAFDSAWRHYPLDSRREEISHRIAWSAVKQVYHKADGKWVPIDPYERVHPDLHSA